ncbi:hypothetical protein [Paenibacillus sp. 1P07SE]|uniref:hypothetical protein n=1 Tax=Paenibacillus sp. 1P07SE TaxID=3132209 RepID=UPI0039A53408
MNNYPIMKPPFEVIDFSERNKDQAYEYFHWFINEIPNRLVILIDAIEVNSINKKEFFDFKPESLSPLWIWLKERLNTVPKSIEEMNTLRVTLPDWIVKEVVDWKIDTPFLSMAIDVSLYFAEAVQYQR